MEDRVNFTKLQNFRLVEIERLQSKCELKLKFVLENIDNIVGKRRKGWLQAFSPFPTIFFQKASCFKAIKSRDCVVKS